MKTRNTYTTQGKHIAFKVDESYYTPGTDKSLVFNSHFKDCKYCVAYTNVADDYHFEDRWGVPEKISDGSVGYQNFNYFNSKEEAVEDFEGRKKLTPKSGKLTFAYADVFLIENDDY